MELIASTSIRDEWGLACRETEPEWDKDIAEDVKEECGKFGEVTHVYVDRNSKVRLRLVAILAPAVCTVCVHGLIGWLRLQGFVYLKFATLDGAIAAQKALHGRWFAGNQVVAEFQFAAPYSDYFRCP